MPARVSEGEVRPEIIFAFGPQFAACDALYEFARSHRPNQSAAASADRLIVATYARGSKTYQGALRLAYIAYGARRSCSAGRSTRTCSWALDQAQPRAGGAAVERLGRGAELQVRRAVEPRADVLEILLDVPEPERHGAILRRRAGRAAAPLPISRSSRDVVCASVSQLTPERTARQASGVQSEGVSGPSDRSRSFRVIGCARRPRSRPRCRTAAPPYPPPHGCVFRLHRRAARAGRSSRRSRMAFG
jgi:hypothetical protein